MSWSTLMLMRSELILTLIVLLLLVLEVALDDKKKKIVVPIAIVLFGIHTIVSFLPQCTGVLFGGMYNSTLLTILMKQILNIGVFIIFLQSANWLKKIPENEIKIPEFFILLLSTLLGMNFMISSGDFVMMYLGLETATIPLAALAAYERYKNQSAEAGIKLILSSALSSGILLYGLSLLYGATGSLYFDEIAAQLSAEPMIIFGMIFFFAGMAFKISIVPFHLWTADVYEGAPISVTSYLSVISKGAAVFIFTMIFYKVFGSLYEHWSRVLYTTAVLTMTIGNLFALRQNNMKRFLAFSSIAQAGFIFLGVIGNSQLGLSTVMYFVLVYIFSNLAAFGVVSIISVQTGKENMSDYDGLYKTNPGLSLILMLALFSLAGIPPVAGFFGKFFLFTAAAQKGYYILVLIAVVNTIVSLYYYLMPVKAMFINKNETPLEKFKSDGYSRMAFVLCIIGLVVTGFTSSIFEYMMELSKF